MVEIAARMRDRAPEVAAADLWEAARAALALRQERRSRQAAAFPAGDDIGRALRRLRKAAKRWPLPNRGDGWVVEGMAAAYRHARRHLRRGLASGDVATLHRARRFAIYQLHHMEWTSPLWPAVFAAWATELERLRGVLGDLHDLDELAGLLKREGLADAVGLDASRLHALIGDRTAALIDDVRVFAARLFAEKPSAYEARMRHLWKAFRADAIRKAQSAPRDRLGQRKPPGPLGLRAVSRTLEEGILALSLAGLAATYSSAS